MYLGFISLGSTLLGGQLTKNTSTLAPANSDAVPTFRVYGPSGLMTGGTGSAALKDTGSITGASNANPIVITSAAHGLTNGTRVTITGVGGNTNANTTATVANKTTDTYELASVAGNGAYTSGGTWNVTGLYKFEVACTAGNGYASGATYTALLSWAVSSVQQQELHTFTVV